MFNKKEKIEFYSTNVNSLYSYPIEKANKIKFTWLDSMRAFFENQHPYFQKTTRCPGIFTPLKYGFVLRSWYDFEVDSRKTDLEYNYPNTDIFLNTQESIKNHVPENFVNFFKDNIIEGRWCHQTLPKIQTSWHVRLPEGYVLLQSNIPYSEETRFSAVTGIYDPNINNNIVVPLYWHEKNTATLIKAGTPLCYLLPIKLTECDYVVREATTRELQWSMYNFRRNNTFIRNYNKMAEVCKKFFQNNQ
jgi:hypothetical protein